MERSTFSSPQVKEIAKGLEKSRQRFLCVVKNPPYSEKAKQNEENPDVDLDYLLPRAYGENQI